MLARFRRLLLLPVALLLTPLAAAPQGPAPSVPVEEILRHVAEKELEYARAHALYRYQISVKIQEIGEDNRVVGEFEQSSQADFDPSGRRLARLLRNPRTDLLHLSVTRVELDDLDFIPLFILSPEEIPEYEARYLGQERLDEVDTYLFHLEPRRPARPNEHLFEGLIWVDAHQLDIVRAHGRTLPARTGGALKGYFRRVEIFREPVDGSLFPTYVRADDVISADQKPTRARLLVRFTHHERVRQPAPSQ